VAGVVLAGGDRCDRRPEIEAAELVFRCLAAEGLLLRQGKAGLSPHRSGEHGVRAPRGALDRAGGGPGSTLGPPRPASPPAARRAGGTGTLVHPGKLAAYLELRARS